jgi:hypothetical protein
MSCCDSCCHSRCNAASTRRMFCTGDSRACIRRPNVPNMLHGIQIVTIQGNLAGDQYIRDVLQPVVVPHFDNHPLDTRPVYMDVSAMPHRSRAVTAYLQSEADPHLAVGCMKQKRLSSDQWILRHVLKFHPRRAKHHAKRVRRCRSANSGR